MLGYLHVWYFKLCEPQEVPVEPFAVRPARCIAFLQLVIVYQSARCGVHQQHTSRTQPILFNYPLRLDLKRSDLGGEYKPVIICYVIP